eukprot:5596756-Lingulodinium_polyedra.AAC.1
MWGWGPDHWRDVVALFPRVDALPAVLNAASTVGQHFGLQVGMRAVPGVTAPPAGPRGCGARH